MLDKTLNGSEKGEALQYCLRCYKWAPLRSLTEKVRNSKNTVLGYISSKVQSEIYKTVISQYFRKIMKYSPFFYQSRIENISLNKRDIVVDEINTNFTHTPLFCVS
jgi:hypothetical protein